MLRLVVVPAGFPIRQMTNEGPNEENLTKLDISSLQIAIYWDYPLCLPCGLYILSLNPLPSPYELKGCYITLFTMCIFTIT